MKELIGNSKVSQAESREHDSEVFAKRVTQTPMNLQERWDRSALGKTEYHGYTDRGVSEGSNGWFIEKWVYAGGKPVSKTIAIGTSWKNRTKAEYK